jgi:HK97 family phage major capsid protein
VHSVDPAYRTGPKVRFMFNDSTLKLLRKLKDGNGQYLWQPGMQAGEGSTLFGYQYTINQDLANVGSSSKSIVFGDFSKYKIRDVRGITVKRLNERYADSDQVGFFALMRTDGRVLDSGTDPIKYITQAA